MKRTGLFLISLVFLTTLFLVLPIEITQAASSALNRTEPLNFTPSVGIPDSEFKAGQEVAVGIYDKKTETMNSTLLGRYIKAIYKYGVSVAAILAAIALMAGGVLWLVSGGDATKVTQAKGLISGSIVGLVILFLSWFILNTINPETLEFRPLSLSYTTNVTHLVQNVVYCTEDGPIKHAVKKDGVYYTSDDLTYIIQKAGFECPEGENCVMINSIWGCVAPSTVKCCQYLKNGVTGITCQTVEGTTACPSTRNGNKLEKIYEGQPCVQDNNSGRNPCIVSG